jgi:hypothetical protein
MGARVIDLYGLQVQDFARDGSDDSIVLRSFLSEYLFGLGLQIKHSVIGTRNSSTRYHIMSCLCMDVVPEFLDLRKVHLFRPNELRQNLQQLRQGTTSGFKPQSMVHLQQSLESRACWSLGRK